VRLWGLTDELNGISETNLAVYRRLGPGLGWTELGSGATGNDGGDYSYAQGTTSDFSAFLLGETGGGNTPTAVTLREFTVHTGANTPVALSLGLLVIVVIGLALALRRRSGQAWRVRNSP